MVVEKTVRKWKRLKSDVLACLQARDFSDGLSTLLRMRPRQVINPLISLFLSSDDIVRWRAITAAGRVVAGLADEDMEGARVIMRRFMWMLNDESGGIGWGAPEAIGEAVACHDRLGREYANMLISYVCQEQNYLEYEPLQRGALWAIGRVAEVKVELVKDAAPCLVPNLEFEDAGIRGLSARAAGLIGIETAEEKLEALLNDHREISFFSDNELIFRTVSSLAQDALSLYGS